MSFYPTFYFSDIYRITPGFLAENNISALILDVDNTLISNTVCAPPEKLSKWVLGLKSAGVSFCILSNGNRKRVESFNKTLNLPVVYKAKKPSRKGFLRALSLLRKSADNCAVVGDQIFTDIWGASRCGLKSVLVEPIDTHEQFFIKFKRLLERPVIRRIKAGKRKV